MEKISLDLNFGDKVGGVSSWETSLYNFELHFTSLDFIFCISLETELDWLQRPFPFLKIYDSNWLTFCFWWCKQKVILEFELSDMNSFKERKKKNTEMKEIKSLFYWVFLFHWPAISQFGIVCPIVICHIGLMLMFICL